MAKMPTVELIAMLARLKAADQEFFIKELGEGENQITYRYRLHTFYSDGNSQHWLHLKGRYQSTGQKMLGVVPIDERLVNLATIIYIKPVPKNIVDARPSA